jgi:hypothetical protein
MKIASALLLGALQALTLASSANAQSTGFVSSAGVTITSTSEKTFVTGTAQADKIAITLPLATKNVKVDGIAGADELAFGVYTGPESFQALVTNGVVTLWENHATGTQFVIQNVAYITFNNGAKIYQVSCNALTRVPAKSATVTAPVCDAIRVTRVGNNTTYIGSSGADTIKVSLGAGEIISVDGLTGENTVVLPGYDRNYSMGVSDSVVFLTENHATGAQISLRNVKFIAFGGGSTIYQVTANGLILVGQYGQTVPQTNPIGSYQNWLRY